MKYTFYYCDNGRMRFGKDSFFTEEFELDSDKDAYLKALEIQDPWDFDRKYFEKMNEKDLVKELDDTDVGAGSPVVFWIKKGSKKIFDTGFTRNDWKRNFA